MRFKLTFRRQSRYDLLPLTYPYFLSAWIYRVLGEADADFATWLHDQGYRLGGRQFRLFVFSQLDVRPFAIEGGCLRIRGELARLEIGFCLDEAGGHFLQGLFEQQVFTLGDAQHRVDLAVESIEMLPPPVWEGGWQRFRAHSPVCVSQTRGPGQPVAYLAPDHPAYALRLADNLQHKLNSRAAALGQAAPIANEGWGFRLESRPKSRLITIAPGTERETKVRGYLYDFALRAPQAWKEMMWYAGLGEKNAMGFGYASLLPTT